MKLIRLFTRRPVTTIMLFCMFLTFGGYSYFKLAKDNFPPIDITVSLVARDQRDLSSMEAVSVFRQLLADIPGVRLTIQSSSSGGPGGDQKPLNVDVRGNNMDDLFSVSEEIVKIMKNTDGTADVDMNWRLGKSELKIIPDYRRCADYGITTAQLAMTLRTSFSGNVGSRYRVDDEEYDIRVRLAEEDRNDSSNISGMPIQTPKGMVRLDSLAKVEFIEGASKIFRADRSRSVSVGANIGPNFALGNVQALVEKQISEIKTPAGVRIKWGGDTEMMKESFLNMAISLLLAIALTYMLLSILLESAILSLALMSTIPFALIGVILSLVVTGTTLNIISLMGIIMLVGIVVNNGIILIEYIQELRATGSLWRDILVQACRVKLRPILMTNTAIMFSMLPMALGLGQGAELRAPMAIVAIGGIFSSTFMTLYILPVLYSLIESAREFFGRKKNITTQ